MSSKKLQNNGGNASNPTTKSSPVLCWRPVQKQQLEQQQQQKRPQLENSVEINPRLLEFLAPGNSFLTPWSWDPVAVKTGTSSTDSKQQMKFPSGSYFANELHVDTYGRAGDFGRSKAFIRMPIEAEGPIWGPIFASSFANSIGIRKKFEGIRQYLIKTGLSSRLHGTVTLLSNAYAGSERSAQAGTLVIHFSKDNLNSGYTFT
ncbi:putative Nucleic acid-binding, OB-fold-like protein [Quillaja saponaria]|uniref:Nucleic acid-binding, OB-fold-like protein n=1 Tax=Quillaja saponaria TaxID=32244 RepID=A0AAD7VLX0_QUISA|nr:putative Nucleic acid-binding, OB-fold-like protein [Quillaja saponaria]